MGVIINSVVTIKFAYDQMISNLNNSLLGPLTSTEAPTDYKDAYKFKAPGTQVDIRLSLKNTENEWRLEYMRPGLSNWSLATNIKQDNISSVHMLFKNNGDVAIPGLVCLNAVQALDNNVKATPITLLGDNSSITFTTDINNWFLVGYNNIDRGQLSSNPSNFVKYNNYIYLSMLETGDGRVALDGWGGWSGGDARGSSLFSDVILMDTESKEYAYVFNHYALLIYSKDYSNKIINEEGVV